MIRESHIMDQNDQKIAQKLRDDFKDVLEYLKKPPFNFKYSKIIYDGDYNYDNYDKQFTYIMSIAPISSNKRIDVAIKYYTNSGAYFLEYHIPVLKCMSTHYSYDAITLTNYKKKIMQYLISTPNDINLVFKLSRRGIKLQYKSILEQIMFDDNLHCLFSIYEAYRTDDKLFNRYKKIFNICNADRSDIIKLYNKFDMIHKIPDITASDLVHLI